MSSRKPIGVPGASVGDVIDDVTVTVSKVVAFGTQDPTRLIGPFNPLKPTVAIWVQL